MRFFMGLTVFVCGLIMCLTGIGAVIGLPMAFISFFYCLFLVIGGFLNLFRKKQA